MQNPDYCVDLTLPKKTLGGTARWRNAGLPVIG
jgi:hypothetical protein